MRNGRGCVPSSWSTAAAAIRLSCLNLRRGRSADKSAGPHERSVRGCKRSCVRHRARSGVHHERLGCKSAKRFLRGRSPPQAIFGAANGSATQLRGAYTRQRRDVASRRTRRLGRRATERPLVSCSGKLDSVACRRAVAHGRAGAARRHVRAQRRACSELSRTR